MEAYYNFVHNLGMHITTIPSILLLMTMAGVGIKHKINQKKKGQADNTAAAEASAPDSSV